MNRIFAQATESVNVKMGDFLKMRNISHFNESLGCREAISRLFLLGTAFAGFLNFSSGAVVDSYRV